MSTVVVHGILITANEAYPFEDFLTEEVGINRATQIMSDGGRANLDRTLWLGWVDDKRQILAVLLSSPNMAAPYQKVTPVEGGGHTITLDKLDDHAAELNFFIYYREQKFMLYQHHYRSLGPKALLEVLRAKYGRRKREMLEEESKDTSKAVKQRVAKKYQTNLSFAISARQESVQDLLERVRGGHLTMVVKNPEVMMLPEHVKRGVVSQTIKLVLRDVPAVERPGWTHGLIEYVRQHGSRALVRGADDEGNTITVNFDDALNKLAYAEYEYEDWLELTRDGLTFDEKTFPFDSQTRQLLAPIRELHGIMASHISTFPAAR